MTAVPLSLAVPAAAAGLAYINARASVSNDAHLVSSAVPAAVTLGWRFHRGRLSQFYVLEERARQARFRERPFVICAGRTWTYAQVYEQALRHGAWLHRRHGVRKGDIVAMAFENSERFLFLWFGLWSLGARPAFINYNLTGGSLVHCVKAATTKLLVVDADTAPRVDDEVRGQIAGVEVVVMTPAMEAEIVDTKPERRPDEERDEDKMENMAILIYTSGTTGLPKAAIVSFAKCIIGAGHFSRWLRRKPGSVMYTSMPLYHASASVLAVLLNLEAGGAIALGKRFSTKTFWREVRESGADAIQYVGETCRYLLAAPPETDPQTGENLDKKHNVKLAFGNGLRPDVWDRFKERFGIDTIAEFYAATEAGFATFNLSSNDFSKGAIGRFGWIYGWLRAVKRDINMRVVAVDFETEVPARDHKTGFCVQVGPGEPGEMIFKLPPADIASRFQGYYGNEKATSDKVMRDVFAKGDAWFRTGDVVSWDREGRVYFSDRIGDTFRWKGENVSTAEVAHVLGEHAAVREANVYGVSLPHHDGRAGCAALVLEDDARVDTDGVMRGLAKHALRGLPRYAVPLFVRVVPDLSAQTTGTNKQQKHVLRKEGVDPGACAPDRLFWLREGAYVPFGKREWEHLAGGKVKL